MAHALISGAGIAGATLAYWLARDGWQTTIVERGRGQRSSGNPVDVRGPALPVAERMGVLPALREAATHATAMRVIDQRGRTVARIPMNGGDGAVEIPRGDLARVLLATTAESTELLLDDTITGLHQDPGGVDVTFEQAAPRRFDLVVGADGLHSAVRRIAFGPETDFVRHLGLHVATLPLGRPATCPDEVVLLNTPGRLLAMHPSRGEEGAGFIFRHPGTPASRRRADPATPGRHGMATPGRHDTAAQKELVTAAYRGVGWRVPELLGYLRAADDFYFDAVSRVTVGSWSRGRVTLLGDAASCVSLFGDGSTLAMAGAHRLATELADSPEDISQAFLRYESSHRALVAPKQRGVRRVAALLVPGSRLTLAARNLAARHLLGRAPSGTRRHD
ncbi:FAD-dependent monooxygenase [Actinoplanes sp. NPDC051851]|uniref:FAD-dependent monooxygenase n=1 Tax=Actinoplanes sp. NPDC051851 TaxID=3154753 RepID=UPI0034399AC9